MYFLGIKLIPKIALEHLLLRKGLHKNMQVEFRDTSTSARESLRDFLGRPLRGKFYNILIVKFGLMAQRVSRYLLEYRKVYKCLLIPEGDRPSYQLRKGLTTENRFCVNGVGRKLSPKAIFLISILMFVLTSMVFAEEQPANNTSAAVEQENEPILPLKQAFQEQLPQELPSKTVTAIEIQGNKSISSNTIIAKMKVKVGSLYQENIVNDDLKRLYLLGFFSDIKIDTQDYKEGLKIVIIVKERPVIEKINFSGIKHLRTKDDKLKQSLKSKEGQYLDYPSLGEDVLIFKKMYEKKGFSQAEINYTTDINKETNKVKLTFTAIENKRVKIKNIFVEGNKAFNDARILKLIKTKRAWLFNTGILKDEVLKEDIERIKTFYRKNGFADAAAEYKINTDAQKPFLYITLNIQEGM